MIGLKAYDTHGRKCSGPKIIAFTLKGRPQPVTFRWRPGNAELRFKANVVVVDVLDIAGKEYPLDFQVRRYFVQAVDIGLHYTCCVG